MKGAFFNYKNLYCGYRTSGQFWIRFYFYKMIGFVVKNKHQPRLFTERYGYIKYYGLPYGWRFKFLRKTI